MAKEVPEWIKRIKTAIAREVFTGNVENIEDGTNETREKDRAILALVADREDGVTNVVIGNKTIIAGLIVDFLEHEPGVAEMVGQIMEMHTKTEQMVRSMMEGTGAQEVAPGIFIISRKEDDDDDNKETVN